MTGEAMKTLAAHDGVFIDGMVEPAECLVEYRSRKRRLQRPAPRADGDELCGPQLLSTRTNAEIQCVRISSGRRLRI